MPTAKLTAAEAAAGVAVGSVAVAVIVCWPLVRAVAGAHDQVPASVAVAVQTAADPSDTVTDASGSLVPEIAAVPEMPVAPPAGPVITGVGAKSVTFATPAPVIFSATLWIVIWPLPLRSRKSADECCWPPKYASVRVTVAVFQGLGLFSGMLAEPL